MSHCVLSRKNTYESRNEGVEAGLDLHIIITNDPLEDFVLSVPATLGSSEIEVPKWVYFCPVPINYNLQLPPGHFGLCVEGTTSQKKSYYLGQK